MILVAVLALDLVKATRSTNAEISERTEETASFEEYVYKEAVITPQNTLQYALWKEIALSVVRSLSYQKESLTNDSVAPSVETKHIEMEPELQKTLAYQGSQLGQFQNLQCQQIYSGKDLKCTAPYHQARHVTSLLSKMENTTELKLEQDGLTPTQDTSDTVIKASKENTSQLSFTEKADNQKSSTSGGSHKCEDYRNLAKKYFPNSPNTALAVMKAESGCNPTAVGDGHLQYVQDGNTYGMSCGLMQVRSLPGRPTCAEMQNPEANIQYAAKLYASGGWSHWSVCKTGKVQCYN